MLDRCRVRADVDALLDDLAPGDTQIVLLQIGAPQSWRLLYPPTRAAAVLARAHCDLPGGCVPMTVTRSPLLAITRLPVRGPGEAMHAASAARHRAGSPARPDNRAQAHRPHAGQLRS
jgi:hypothetical protein